MDDGSAIKLQNRQAWISLAMYLPLAGFLLWQLMVYRTRRNLARTRVTAMLTLEKADRYHGDVHLLFWATMLRGGWFLLRVDNTASSIDHGTNTRCVVGTGCSGHIVVSLLSSVSAILHFLYCGRIAPYLGAAYLQPQSSTMGSKAAGKAKTGQLQLLLAAEEPLQPALPDAPLELTARWSPPAFAWDMSLMAADYFLLVLQFIALMVLWVLDIDVERGAALDQAYQLQLPLLYMLLGLWCLGYAAFTLRDACVAANAEYRHRLHHGQSTASCALWLCGLYFILPEYRRRQAHPVTTLPGESDEERETGAAGSPAERDGTVTLGPSKARGWGAADWITNWGASAPAERRPLLADAGSSSHWGSVAGASDCISKGWPEGGGAGEKEVGSVSSRREKREKGKKRGERDEEDRSRRHKENMDREGGAAASALPSPPSPPSHSRRGARPLPALTADRRGSGTSLMAGGAEGDAGSAAGAGPARGLPGGAGVLRSDSGSAYTTVTVSARASVAGSLLGPDGLPVLRGGPVRRIVRKRHTAAGAGTGSGETLDATAAPSAGAAPAAAAAPAVPSELPAAGGTADGASGSSRSRFASTVSRIAHAFGSRSRSASMHASAVERAAAVPAAGEGGGGGPAGTLPAPAVVADALAAAAVRKLAEAMEEAAAAREAARAAAERLAEAERGYAAAIEELRAHGAADLATEMRDTHAESDAFFAPSPPSQDPLMGPGKHAPAPAPAVSSSVAAAGAAAGSAGSAETRDPALSSAASGGKGDEAAGEGVVGRRLQQGKGIAGTAGSEATAIAIRSSTPLSRVFSAATLAVSAPQGGTGPLYDPVHPLGPRLPYNPGAVVRVVGIMSFVGVLFLLRALLFLLTALSETGGLGGTLGMVAYPFFFYTLPETLPPLLFTALIMPDGWRGIRTWYSRC